MASKGESIRPLFIINALSRITKKNLLTLSDLQQGIESKLEEITIQLFLQRPNMNSSTSKEETLLTLSLLRIEEFYNENKLYVDTFGKDTFEVIQIHIDKLKKEKDEVI